MEKVIHLDQVEFLPIFPYSELLIWMLHQLTNHSYFDSVYLKIFTALFFGGGGGGEGGGANYRLLSFTNVL